MKGATDLLLELITKCKGEVSFTCNEHKKVTNGYDSINEFIYTRTNLETDQAIIDKIIATNTVIELQFYPTSHVGFFTIYHYDLRLAIEQALSTFS